MCWVYMYFLILGSETKRRSGDALLTSGPDGALIVGGLAGATDIGPRWGQEPNGIWILTQVETNVAGAICIF